MDILDEFATSFDCQPSVLGRAPGRVNLLGEHVDYNGGAVLPAAIDREVILAAVPVEESTVSLHALDLPRERTPRVTFHLDDLPAKMDIAGKPLPGWALYPAGVAWELQNAGLDVRGMQAVFTSDVPVGSGLSSSAALEVGFAVIWRALGGWEMDGLTLARHCQRAENLYVGVNCGLMDQFASANGVEGHAVYFDTRSLEWEPVLLPPGTSIIIADSGVRRSLTSSGYNERRASCEEAVLSLRRFYPGMISLRDISPPEFAALSDYLAPVVRMRAEHVVKEIARVESARTALLRQDARAFGALMYASHASLRDLYEVSVPELDILVDLTRFLPGCLGARLTGAGFGGCTVNLVESQAAESFISGLIEGYQGATGRVAQVYLCRASQGATAGLA